jgi:hypothetical protein
MTPKLQGRINSFSPYFSIVAKYSQEFDVPVNVINAVIIQESGGNPKAFNPTNGENSRGLMQISEALAKGTFSFGFFDLSSLFNPDVNIKHGAKYLSQLRNQLSVYFDTNISEMDKWKIIVSSYNQGSGYWIKALKQAKKEKIPQTWEIISKYMVRVGAPSGTLSALPVYGPSVMSYLAEEDLTVSGKFVSGANSVVYKTLKLTEENPWLYSLPAIAVVGVIGYYYINKKGKSYGNKSLNNDSRTIAIN